MCYRTVIDVTIFENAVIAARHFLVILRYGKGKQVQSHANPEYTDEIK